MEVSLVPPSIELKDINKDYGDVHALKGLSFKLESGERCALLGPNGAGKTTTLKILVGLLSPTSGEARIGNLAPSSEDARRMMGYLPDDASPYRSFSVRENLEYIGALRGIESVSDKVDQLLDSLKLREYERAKVGRLSRGNVQKLALALAIIHRPSVLFLDEPLNYLDIPTQETVIDQLKNLNSTQLVSTHIMEVATRLTDRVVMISHGSVVWNGTLDDLKKLGKDGEPIERVVARMLTDVL
jgi:ABC-2 type transport system ATP-binding protein